MEGIEYGKRFYRVAELSYNGVTYGKKDPASVIYDFCTKIIVVNPEKLKAMIEEIKKEEEKKKKVSFSLIGNKSLFSSDQEHNCISWALDKYEKKLNYTFKIKKSFIDLLFTNPRSFVRRKKDFLSKKPIDKSI